MLVGSSVIATTPLSEEDKFPLNGDGWMKKIKMQCPDRGYLGERRYNPQALPHRILGRRRSGSGT